MPAPTMRRFLALTLLLAACASGTPKAQDDAGTPPPDAPVVPPPSGKTGARLVPAAIKAKSANYKMVGTLTVGDGRTTSANHVKNGGVVGATQP